MLSIVNFHKEKYVGFIRELKRHFNRHEGEGVVHEGEENQENILHFEYLLQKDHKIYEDLKHEIKVLSTKHAHSMLNVIVQCKNDILKKRRKFKKDEDQLQELDAKIYAVINTLKQFDETKANEYEKEDDMILFSLSHDDHLNARDSHQDIFNRLEKREEDVDKRKNDANKRKDTIVIERDNKLAELYEVDANIGQIMFEVFQADKKLLEILKDDDTLPSKFEDIMKKNDLYSRYKDERVKVSITLFISVD